MGDNRSIVDNDCSGRWGVILAGGDGKRLLPLTRKLTGEDRPKQFCALSGIDTLLKQTWQRVSHAVPQSNLLLVLTRTHERFYVDQIRGIPTGNLLVQPYNRGTAPAIVYSLTRLKAVAPDGLVGIFPSDHHFKNNETLVGAVNEAFQHVESHGEHIVLLGVAPDSPEDGYGWIEHGVPLHRTNAGPILEVRRFWEKPSPDIARNLMQAGGLWNSFIMVGRVSVFLDMIRRSVPNLLASFEYMWAGVQPGMEGAALYELFSRVPNSNFSHEVLSVCPSDLAVLSVEGLGWTDLGEPERVLSALKVNPGQSDEDLLRGEQRAESDSMIFEQAGTQTNQTNSALVSMAKQAYKCAEGLAMISPSPPPLNMNSSAGHILYVEDNEDTRDLVTCVLALSNYTVVTAENYDDGLRLARAESFDLYLIDHWMVGGSGIELCQKLREFDPQTPILFYSGVAYERDKQEAFAAGAQGYLVKPAENEALIKEVSRAISGAKEKQVGIGR